MERSGQEEVQSPVSPPTPTPAAEERTQNTTSNFVNPLYDVLGFFRRVENDEGTVLRRHLAKARHQVNDLILGAKSTVDDSRRTLQSQQQALGFPVSRIEGTISSFRAFARQHTELTLTGVALAVAIPSSIAGRKAMLINSLFAAAGTAATLRLADWYDRRRGGRAE